MTGLREVGGAIVGLAPLAVAQVEGLTASSLGNWLLGLAAVAVIINQVAGAWKKMRGKPIGMEVAENCTLLHRPMEQRLSTVESRAGEDRALYERRFQRINEKFERLIDKLEKAIIEQGRKNEERDRGLQELYQDILAAVSRHEGEIENHG